MSTPDNRRHFTPVAHLRDHSLTAIEEALAKALSELTGKDLAVSVGQLAFTDASHVALQCQVKAAPKYLPINLRTFDSNPDSPEPTS